MTGDLSAERQTCVNWKRVNDLATPNEDKSMELSYKPLTIDQSDDFVSLFGERGACGGYFGFLRKNSLRCKKVRATDWR